MSEFNSYIIGACLYNDDVIYIESERIKTLSDSIHGLTEDDSYYFYTNISVHSQKRGKLFDLPFILHSSKGFSNSEFFFNESLDFKSIKVVNGSIFILFNNHNPLIIDKDLKGYKEFSSDCGMITSLDYVNGVYIVGISDTKITNSMNDLIYSSGNRILIGKDLFLLKEVEKVQVKDIIYDKYRDLLYISSIYELKIYDNSLNLLRTIKNNPLNSDRVKFRKRYLINSNYNDARRVLIENDQLSSLISFNDSIDIGGSKLISTGEFFDGLHINGSKTFVLDENVDRVIKSGLNKIPLFNDILSLNRIPDSFSLFSKDEENGVVVEFNYNNKLIIYFPNKNFGNLKKVSDIEITINVEGGVVDYRDLAISVSKDIILIRSSNYLYIYKIDYLNYTVNFIKFIILSDIGARSEIIPFIIKDDKVLIPIESNSIMVLDYNNLESDPTYIEVSNLNDQSRISQIIYFDNLLMCACTDVMDNYPVIDSKSALKRYIGVLNYNGESYNMIALDHTSHINYNNIEDYHVMRKSGNELDVIYNDSLLLSFNKDELYIDDVSNMYTNLIEFKELSYNGPVISIDNPSIANSTNRNFYRKEKDFNEKYDLMEINDTGIVRDFNNDFIYKVRDIGAHFIISDTFTERKRIDVSIKMGKFNTVVKRIKTDNYDVNICENIPSWISAYLEQTFEEGELDKLCTLILSNNGNL